MLKGVAILFMLYLHLFNQMPNVEQCTTFMSVGDLPLVHWLTRASNPVSFFLILGGYGMYIVWEKGDKHRYLRLFRLYSHYWLVLAVFVGIGAILYPNRYPGTMLTILKNVTSYHTTYNGECWFLLPYVLISFSSAYLFRILSKVKAWKILTVTYIISFITSYIISRRVIDGLFDNLWLYNPFLYFHEMFSFMLGAMAAREGWIKYLDKIKLTRWNWAVAVLLVIACCIIRVSVFCAPYPILLMAVFLRAPKWGWVNKVLIELGRKSMDMWFIHSWFCYYLFHDFIYSFQYPLLIFVVLVLISYTCAVFVQYVIRGIEWIWTKLSNEKM